MSYSNIGRLGDDPKEIQPKDSRKHPFVAFSLAVDEGFGDNKHTDWLDCAIYGKRGKVIMDFCRKGQQLFVVGNISVRTFKDRTGKDQMRLALSVLDFKFCGDKQGGQRAGGQQGGQQGGYDRYQDRRPPQGQQRAPAQRQQPQEDYDQDVPYDDRAPAGNPPPADGQYDNPY